MSGTSEGPTPATDLIQPNVTHSDATPCPGTEQIAVPAAGQTAAAAPSAPSRGGPDAPLPATGGTTPMAESAPAPAGFTGMDQQPSAAPRRPLAEPPFRSAFSAAPLAMAVVDRDGLVVSANDTFGALFGGGPEEFTGQVAADLVDLTSDPRIRQAYQQVLDGRRARLRCARRLKHPDGHPLWVQITVAPLAPESPNVLLSVADISARRELQDRLRHVQNHDPVTRLPNRTLFFERLSAALEAESYESGGSGRVGLCYLDLDGFKAVNDSHGHAAGDEILQRVADALRRVTGPDELVARIGGDEFVALLRDADALTARAVADEIIAAIAREHRLADGRAVRIGCSVGMCTAPEQGREPEVLLARADAALYEVKAQGKGYTGMWRAVSDA